MPLAPCPSLALLTLFAIVPWISLKWGGFLAAFLALVVLAIPPILTNTYVGMREVDADVRDAAKAMGMTGGQVLRTVELPLAAPFLMAGVRTASIEVVATSTLGGLRELRRPRDSGDLRVSTPTTPSRPSPAPSWSPSWPPFVALGLGVLQRVMTPEPLRRRMPAPALGCVGRVQRRWPPA